MSPVTTANAPASEAKKPNLILDGHKLQWHQERVKAWLAGERIAPITIDCALTRACSYRCQFCYATLQDNDSQNMTHDVVMRFLDDAAEVGVKAISFVSDGESTVSPHIYNAVLRGHANGLSMAMGTNGYLLKDERLDDILPALTYLRFNVSGGERERYAKIMGVKPECYDKVMNTVRNAVRIKRERGLSVTIGLQMVLMPDMHDQILPMARLGKELGVDYTVIKHCSDDEKGSLGVDYSKYFDYIDLLEQAEAMSTPTYLVKAKWSKILSNGKRKYSQCYGAPFITQFSGSGLVAPCGMLFNDRYKKNFHIGNIATERFRDIVRGERYWEVMDHIASTKFDARTMCGSLCLQHKVNEFLWDLKHGDVQLLDNPGDPPPHVNFI
jgi:MoaA/NifB/PqqE/SkfB family radical SAM enzyme